MTAILPPGSVPCFFCCEPVSEKASLCPHCRGALTPVRDLTATNAALTSRLADMEAELTALRETGMTEAPEVETPEPPPAPTRSFCLGTLLEHLFIGAAILFVSRMLLADLPAPPRAMECLLPLMVAVPFGLHFERKGRPHLTGQILGALVFGVLGVVVIASVDLLSEAPLRAVLLRDRVQAGLALGLGHFAGSMTGRWWQNHLERKRRLSARSSFSAAGLISLLRDPERLKAELETYRTLIEAGAPVAAAATAVWASLGR